MLDTSLFHTLDIFILIRGIDYYLFILYLYSIYIYILYLFILYLFTHTNIHITSYLLIPNYIGTPVFGLSDVINKNF